MTNQPRRLSRRQLLKGSAILGAGAALTACAAPAAPAAQKPADAAAPAAAPAAGTGASPLKGTQADEMKGKKIELSFAVIASQTARFKSSRTRSCRWVAMGVFCGD